MVRGPSFRGYSRDVGNAAKQRYHLVVLLAYCVSDEPGRQANKSSSSPIIAPSLEWTIARSSKQWVSQPKK